MAKLLVTTGILLALMLTESTADTKNKEVICNERTTVPVDMKVVGEIFSKGIYVAMIKKLELKGPPKPHPPAEKKDFKNNWCFKATVKTPLGNIDGDGECKYDTLAYLRCNGFGSGGLADMEGSGDIWAVKTDNKTYVIYVGCVDMEEPFWIVLSPQEKLTNTTESEHLEHLQAMGFDIADAAEEDDPPRGTKLDDRKCTPGPGQNPFESGGKPPSIGSAKNPPSIGSGKNPPKIGSTKNPFGFG